MCELCQYIKLVLLLFHKEVLLSTGEIYDQQKQKQLQDYKCQFGGFIMKQISSSGRGLLIEAS